MSYKPKNIAWYNESAAYLNDATDELRFRRLQMLKKRPLNIQFDISRYMLSCQDIIDAFAKLGIALNAAAEERRAVVNDVMLRNGPFSIKLEDDQQEKEWICPQWMTEVKSPGK